jgi:hypothetical protein
MAVPAPMSTFHRVQTRVQRNSLGFEFSALNHSAIGDDPSPGMLYALLKGSQLIFTKSRCRQKDGDAWP